jgi:phosphoglycolate phosphatase-like HAD superfamily hydrolase
MTALVLWDIDRTLIDAGGIDKQVWLDVCAELTGLPTTRPASTSGQTDPQILLAILTATGIGHDRALELLPQALQREAEMLAQRQEQLGAAGRALPGARQALHALSTIPGVTQTVVTGNVRPNAELKLATYGLAAYIDFSIGGYGSDDADRATLIKLAQQRARDHRRWVGSTADVVVVGDSPRDVQAARAAGVRVIAIATGRTPSGQLGQACPDHLLPDLTDTDVVLTAILNGAAQPLPTKPNGSDEDRRAARALAAQAISHVAHASGREPLRAVLKWITRGRLGTRHGWAVVPDLGTPWQDTISGERTGWRQRTAYLHGHIVFGVDYQVCHRCGLGWVEQPATDPRYQRCGLAAAGLAALRKQYPGLEWHTLGGHFRDSEPFWSAVGAGVSGGYTQRNICLHRPGG